ncbi:hypothetical protein [Streptococcus sp. 263_SSPC]|uniref:hypothetical protein n=1 Tax=Streptococcus sp. 263_SSPC TaxID=1579343 RepID=UPI000AF0BF0A|nr:hypothetical protein [Streptococcus sp. 263_SSPC]
MATKSFTTDMMFNYKNTDSLIAALSNSNRPKLTTAKANLLKGKEEVSKFVTLLKNKK